LIRNKSGLHYTLDEIDQLSQDIRGIVQSRFSTFYEYFSTIYPLFSPILTTLSFQMAMLSLSLGVAPNEKEKFLKYGKDSAKTLAFVQPEDGLLGCVIYIISV